MLRETVMAKRRRRFHRIPFNVPAELTVNEVSYHADSIINLSVGGCLFPLSADSAVAEEAICSLVIPLNEQDKRTQVEVRGEVIYYEPGMAGIKFTHIDPDSLFHLQNIIRYNAPDVDEIEHEIHTHPGLV